MENIKHEENEETLNDMNIIIEHQFNIKQWNHILNNLQNQTIDKSTRKHVHPYTNINHTHLDQNSQPLELQNIPITEIDQ
jgi:hypothetical protein